MQQRRLRRFILQAQAPCWLRKACLIIHMHCRPAVMRARTTQPPARHRSCHSDGAAGLTWLLVASTTPSIS